MEHDSSTDGLKDSYSRYYAITASAWYYAIIDIMQSLILYDIKLLIFVVLQQISKKLASFQDGGPHRVTSSKIHQIKAKSLLN